MRRHSPQQQYKQACQIAKDHNMFVVDKGSDRYLVYRRAAPKNVFIAECKSADALFHKVSRCAGAA